MNIKELHSKGEIGVKCVDVHMTYDECRDISNGLTELLCIARDNKDTKTFNRYKDICKKSSKLFHIVKCGWLLDDDLKYINHIVRDLESEVEE